MFLHRVLIEDCKVLSRIWWFEPTKLSDVKLCKKIQKEIDNVFPNETYTYPVNHIYGMNHDDNGIIFHMCSPFEDEMATLSRKHSLKAQNVILTGKAYVRYLYDIENKSKTFEVIYRDRENFGYDDYPDPIVDVPDTVKINSISEFYNEHFEKISENLLLEGYENVKAVYDFADSLNKDIPKPIPVDKKVHKDDLFKFMFDKEGNLERIILAAHIDRVSIREKGSYRTEYKADYADCLINLDETEIVVPEYDDNGNPMKSSKPKDNEEYILFPKARDNGYEKVKIKDF
jgi:hypothetical protein